MTIPTIELEPNLSGSRGRIRLTVTAGPHCGLSWTFETPLTLTIGRESPANLVLERELALSRMHWRVKCTDSNYYLTDEGSRNGTLVNGLRVVEASLQHGDRFGIGETELSFEILTEMQSGMGDGRPLMKPKAASQTTTPVRPADHVPSIAKTNNWHADVAETQLLEGSGRMLSRQSVSKGQGASDSDSAPTETKPARSQGKSEGQFSFTGQATDRNGEQVGSYVLTNLLGRGGMGEVYKATRRTDGTPVAIKFLRVDVQPTEKQLQLFAREAGIILRLDHPRIVRGIEFGIQGKFPYLVLEYIPAIDLLKLIDSQPLEQKIRTSLWIIRRVLSTTEYLHKQKLIHRDIKPSNLLAYREEHRLKVKLADFGLAKLAENSGFSGLTSEKSIRGTLAFMSPQQFRDSRRSRPSDDLFSIGACLYRFLVGQNPNVISGLRETTQRLSESGLPIPLINVINKAIAPQASDRFQNSTSFIKAVELADGR